jgi:DNA-binding phage protein
LITSAMVLTTPPQIEMLSHAIRLQMMKINVNNAASQMHLSRELMYSWLRGVRKPKLSTLLQVSLGLRISPLELLTGNAVSASTDGRVASVDQDIHGRRRKTPSSPVEVLRSLEAVLLSSEKPTVKAVSKDLGYSNTCAIYKYSPDLCRAIASKRRTDAEHVQELLEAIMADDEDPPPSMQEVARRLGYSVQLLNRHFPEICRAISERYVAYQKRKRDETVRLKCDEVRSIVIRVYEQGEYPSQRKVRNLLRNPHDFLRKEVHTAWRETLQRLGISG